MVYTYCVEFVVIKLPLYIRDHESLSFSGQKYHSHNNFMVPWQVRITKPKSAFETLPKSCYEVAKKK